MISNRRREFIIHSIFRNIYTHLHTHRHKYVHSYTFDNEILMLIRIYLKLCKLHVCETVMVFFQLRFFLFWSFWFVYSFCSGNVWKSFAKNRKIGANFFSAVKTVWPAFLWIDSNSQIVTKIHLNDRYRSRMVAIFVPWGDCVKFYFE